MNLVHPLIELFAAFPKLAGLFGLGIAILFGIGGVANLIEVQQLPEQPVQMALADVPAALESQKEIWAELSEVTWDCSNSIYDKSADRTAVVFTDQAQSILGVATFSDELKCSNMQGKPAAGIVSRMDDSFYTRLPGRGFDLSNYSAATTRLDLCTFCSRGNSIGLIVLSAIFVPLGLGMYPLALKLKANRERNPRRGPV